MRSYYRASRIEQHIVRPASQLVTNPTAGSPAEAVMPPRPRARLLCWEMPCGDVQAVLPPGLTLSSATKAQVVVVHYPDVWEPTVDGVAGSKLPSHSEMTVHVPVEYKGKQYMHCVYALSDGDIAMNLAREAHGVPSKAAVFDLELASATGAKVRARVSRREAEVLSLGCHVLSSATTSTSLTELFRNELNVFGTQSALPPIPGMNNAVSTGFLHLQRSIAVHQAWQLQVDSLDIKPSVYEPLSLLFGKDFQVPATASLLEMDIGHTTDQPPIILGPLELKKMDFVYFYASYFLKYGGGPRLSLGDTVDTKPSGGFQWQNGTYIWLTMMVDTVAIAHLVPPGATLLDDKADFFCVFYPTARLNEAVDEKLAFDNFPYHEFGVKLRVKVGDKEYRHIVYILVDDDVAMILGRDFMGCPKKMAVFDFPRDAKFGEGDEVGFSISRDGRPVMEFSGKVGGDTGDWPIPGLRDERLDMCVGFTQFPHYCRENGTQKKLAAGQLAFVTFGGNDNFKASRQIDSARASFTGGELEGWFIGQPVAAGFLRQDWALQAGIPTVGILPSPDAAAQYWRSTYTSRYRAR